MCSLPIATRRRLTCGVRPNNRCSTLHRGVPGPLPRPVRDFEAGLDAQEQSILKRWFTCSASGTPELVAERLATFAEHTGVDEIMVTSNIHDHAARLRSYEITAEAGTALA